jgi:hypothetical protein
VALRGVCTENKISAFHPTLLIHKYNLKNQPDLLVLLLYSEGQSNDIENEVMCLEQLEALGMKTPKRYKQITFVEQSTPNFNIQQRGLVVHSLFLNQHFGFGYLG